MGRDRHTSVGDDTQEEAHTGAAPLVAGLVGKEDDGKRSLLSMKNHTTEQSRQEGEVMWDAVGQALSNSHRPGVEFLVMRRRRQM